MEFLIGNGQIFEKKDVMTAIRNLDPDSKADIVYEILGSLIENFKKLDEHDTIKLIKSEEVIRYINKIALDFVEYLDKNPTETKKKL